MRHLVKILPLMYRVSGGLCAEKQKAKLLGREAAGR